MSEAIVQLHAMVRGRVQGVNFRHHTQHSATQLGVRGWVRNLPNGTVEAMGQGPRSALEQWLEFLRAGPRFARVSGVEIEWQATLAPLSHSGFEVLR